MVIIIIHCTGADFKKLSRLVLHSRHPLHSGTNAFHKKKSKGWTVRDPSIVGQSLVVVDEDQ